MMQVITNYIRADRSIEKYVYNGKVLFVFNDQGLYFDVFLSKEKLMNFLDNKIERGDLFFDNELQLNKYLSI